MHTSQTTVERRRWSSSKKILLFLGAYLASLLITGYQDIYGSNHAFQLVLVQKLNNPELYPHDPLADAVKQSYAAVFWYGVAWLARVVDLRVVLLLLFLVNRLLLLWAGYRLGQAMFPNARYAGAAGVLSIAALPNALFADAHAQTYTQQTGFALAFGLLAIDACLRRQWMRLAVWLGLSINMNPMFALFALSYTAASWLVQGEARARVWKFAGVLASALAIGAHGVYLLLRAGAIPVSDPQAVWQAAELAYPYHFFPQTWELSRQFIALALAGFTIWLSLQRSLVEEPTARYLRVWTIIAVGWYAAAVINPLWLHWRPLLHLHPARAIVYWQMLILLGFAGVVITRAEHTAHSPNRFSFAPIAMAFVVLGFFVVSPLRAAILGGVVAGLEKLRLYLQRQNSRQLLKSPAQFSLSVALAGLLSLGTILHAYRIHRAGHWSGIPHYPAYTIAAWAHQNTPHNATFLVPLVSEGWPEFRHLSQRSVFCQRRDGAAWPFAPWYAPEWLRRLQALGFYETTGLRPEQYTIGAWLWLWALYPRPYEETYDRLDEPKVRSLHAQYRIDYWVTRIETPTTFPEVFRAGDWKVARVRQ